MPIQVQAVRERLLDLFPAPTVHALAGLDGQATKAEAATAVAAAGDLDVIRAFVADNFGRLHQHVYLFEHDGEAVEPAEAFDEPAFGEREDGENEQHCFFLLPLTYDLVLDNPLGEQTLTFAWPLKLVVAPDHVRLHATIMAKSPSAYVEDGRGVVKAVQNPTESELLRNFPQTIGLASAAPLDLNRGIKALWEGDEYDAPSVRYKRQRSTSRDVMDESFMVKKDDPALYGELVDKPLFDTTLWFGEDDPCIDYFVVDPTAGTMGFRRYSDTNECVDSVIRRILAAN